MEVQFYRQWPISKGGDFLFIRISITHKVLYDSNVKEIRRNEKCGYQLHVLTNKVLSENVQRSNFLRVFSR